MKKRKIYISILFLFWYNNGVAQTAEDYFKRGKVYADSSDFTQASILFTLAIKLNPYDWRYYKSRSWAFYNLKDLKLAIHDINTCLDLKPNHENPDALYSRGKLLLEFGNYSKSIEDWSYLIKYFPNEFIVKVGLAHLFRGKALLYSNKKDDACVDFHESSTRRMHDANEYILKYCK
jgi:tetratricopeptide (TPR) repeat protein